MNFIDINALCCINIFTFLFIENITELINWAHVKCQNKVILNKTNTTVINLNEMQI